jgi:membrane-associated phospholipid phosphatase
MNDNLALMPILLARAVSIVGHPIVLLLVAALIAASTRGASARQLWFIGGAMLAFGVVVLGFSWIQVRAGRWSHVDASVATERKSLNLFLGALCLSGAALLWFVTHRAPMPIALMLSGTLIGIALLLSSWIKVSLHSAFAAFATTLLWPIVPAIVAGALVTAAVVWSRLVLGRHVAADVAAGLVLGIAAGVAFHVGIAHLAAPSP